MIAQMILEMMFVFGHKLALAAFELLLFGYVLPLQQSEAIKQAIADNFSHYSFCH